MKKYLNEEQYQNTNKKLSIAALILLIVGVSIGGLMIYNGTKSPDQKELQKYEETLKQKMEELQNKGVVACGDYTCGEGYDLYIVKKAMHPSFSYCKFDEYRNNTLTKEYCEEKEPGSSKIFLAPLGAFIAITSCMFAGMLFLTTKRRSMLAYSAQQVMPIAKEGIEEMTPTAKKMMEDMAPTYGKIAEEITKGIKKGKEE